jgi:hypothetical protein
MSGKEPSDVIALWEQLVASHRQYLAASHEFFTRGVDRVALMRSELQGANADVAIVMAPKLAVEERKALMGELVYLAVNVQGLIAHVREAIWTLPKEWLVSNIERFSESFVLQRTEWEYRRLLELYEGIDKDLTLRLAREAALSSDDSGGRARICRCLC